ncbi:MAG: C40 family peptidase [Rhodocyclaceae bacterium]|nr:C40 family peptidase [Rhodocyclaceae bacterium]
MLRHRFALLTLASALLISTAAVHAEESVSPAALTVTATTTPSPATSIRTPRTDPVAELVVQALSFLGIPYRYGGQSRDTGLDCSALVQQVFRDAIGLALPRTTGGLARVGQNVERSSLKAGDLVFFNTRRRAFSHVGLYLGDNRFLHAPSKGGKVRVERLSTSYWATRFNGGRRIIAATSSATADRAI